MPGATHGQHQPVWALRAFAVAGSSDRTQLAKQSSLVNYQPGQGGVRRGELARTQAFLIEGEIELQDERQATRLRATDPEACYALAPGPGARRQPCA